MSKPAVYVVDDQPAVRLALSEMLSVFGYDVQVFETALSLLERLPSLRPGCIVTDVRMPGMNGLELMRELSRREVRMPVVMISGHADVPLAVAAMKAGAEDLIEKPIDDELLVAAINRCLARLVEQLQDRQSREELESRFATLTPREREVFDFVVQGFTSHAVAGRMGISSRTVESHRVQIMEKMQAASVAVLVRQAVRLGRLEP